MRTGVNPGKLDFKIDKIYHHRIIIPVFIPNFEGYFQNIFDVFKTCVESAWLSQHNRSAITVVDNGSCQEVSHWLREQNDKGIIETLITHSKNIGKVDAILGAARGCREELITLSDGDILFKNGWQNAVEKVFLNFERAGSVAPFPISRHLYYFSSSVQKAVVKGALKFKFEKSQNPEAIKEVYQCYGWDFNTDYDSLLPVVRSGSQSAVVGSGHQIMTIRREAIFSMPTDPCFIKISNKSENLWIDKPIDDFDFWRLSTQETWVSHMGNQLTAKNKADFASVVENKEEIPLLKLPVLKARKSNSIVNRGCSKLFRKLFDPRGQAPKLKLNAEQDGK